MGFTAWATVISFKVDSKSVDSMVDLLKGIWIEGDQAFEHLCLVFSDRPFQSQGRDLFYH